MTTTTLSAAPRSRNYPDPVQRARCIGTAAALLAMPAIFVFAFATHPELGSLRPLEPAELILRARDKPVLQFAHALVTLNTALLVVVAVHLQSLLRVGRGAWAGLVGGAMAVLGACLLAGDKGAMCLTMSALDNLNDATFTAMMPGLVAIFDKQGWMILVWGMALLPLGVAVQAVGLIRSGQWPMGQAVTLLAGSLLIAAPDGMEIINLTAAVLILVALAPHAIHLARDTTAFPNDLAASRCRNCRHRLAAATLKTS